MASIYINPIEELVEITPDDDNALATPVRALYVGTSGDVKLKDLHGNTRTLPDLAAGVFHPVWATHVFDTGTAATDILGGI